MSSAPEAKFDIARTSEYAVQSRIALAGYDACHELAACLLGASLGHASEAHVLVAGVGGTAQEILVAAKLAPRWRFTAVDPSPPMLAGARAALESAGLAQRADLRLGRVEDLPQEAMFDAATLIGVLHHLPGEAAKRDILAAVTARLKPGAPLILACNRRPYGGMPMFLAAWRERWRMHGADEGEIEAKLGKILKGADPPASDEEVCGLLDAVGCKEPTLFFSSLFWGGWIATRDAG